MAAREYTDTEILDRAQRAQADWQGRNERILAAREARFNMKPPKAPPEAKRLTNLPPPRIPLVGELVNSAQGLFAAQLPLPIRNPLNPTDPDDIKASSRLERALLSGYEQLFGYPNNVFPKLTDAFIVDGQAVWKTIPDRHKFYIRKEQGEPDERYLNRVKAARREQFPFISEHIDTTAYYPVARNERGRPVEVLEISERELGDLYEQFNTVYDMSSFTGGHWGDTVQLIERWTETEFQYIVRDRTILKKPHRLRRVPYFDPEFSTTSMKDRKYQTVGLADNLVGLQDAIASIELMEQAYEFWTAYPMFTLVPIGDEYRPIRGDMTFEATPLGTVKAPPGYKWVPVVMPSFGEGLIRHRDFLMGMANDVRLAPILYGRIEHAQSGPTTSTQLDTAKSRFNVGTANLRGAFNDHAAMLLYYTDKVLKEPVPTQYLVTENAQKERHGEWIELDPKDIKGYFTVDHKLEPTTQLERGIKSQQANNLFSLGILPARIALEENGYPNPDQVLQERDRDDLAHSPEAKQAIMAEATAEFQELVAKERGLGTPEVPPLAPGGPGIPQVAGIGQPMMPGVSDQMATRPPIPGIGPEGGVPLG